MRYGPHPSEHHRHGARWTPRDDARLRLLWGSCSLSEMAATLGRSELTTYWRGRGLGLQCGAPPHGEYLHAAAKRAGYTSGQLRRILRASGVVLHPTISRPSGRARTYHWVDPVEVDDAIAEWHATEELEPAARARGVCSATLVRLLDDDGAARHRSPGRSKKKSRRRYRTEDIDRVVAKYREDQSSRMSVRQHALRLGLDRVTLARRLRKAHVLGPKRPGVEVRLPSDIVDIAAGVS
ncbi:MAG: hypothetical protein HOV80_17805 [Polyangiaceae bacterium]|nr:hypothetical protein [Polyangiaceae bacterium]